MRVSTTKRPKAWGQSTYYTSRFLPERQSFVAKGPEGGLLEWRVEDPKVRGLAGISFADADSLGNLYGLSKVDLYGLGAKDLLGRIPPTVPQQPGSGQPRILFALKEDGGCAGHTLAVTRQEDIKGICAVGPDKIYSVGPSNPGMRTDSNSCLLTNLVTGEQVVCGDRHYAKYGSRLVVWMPGEPEWDRTAPTLHGLPEYKGASGG